MRRLGLAAMLGLGALPALAMGESTVPPPVVASPAARIDGRLYAPMRSEPSNEPGSDRPVPGTDPAPATVRAPTPPHRPPRP